MLSRHFYEINEVCNALIQSLRKGLIDESVFWGRELILSCESELLQKTMIQAWILWLGSRNIHWLDIWAKCDDDVEKMVLVAEFCILRSKMSKQSKKTCLYPFIMCARGSTTDLNDENMVTALNMFNPFSLYYNLGNDYIQSPTAAVEYISEMVESVIEPILLTIKYVKNVKLKILLLAVAAQVACLREYPADICIVKKDYVVELLVKWDETINRRKGRLFAIKENDMIHGKKRVTQDVGLFIGHQEIFKNGSAFWKQYIDSTDDELIDSLFPDDIPDEWSFADRSLSHPIKFKPYKIYYKPEYKFKQIWGFAPFIKRSWITELDTLWKTVSCPSI